jgi:hypothetical protein
MKTVAQAISRIFDPIIEIPVMFGLTVWYAYVNGHSWLFLSVLLFINAVLPFLFFLHLLRKKEIHDWDIRRRKERIPVYAFALTTQIAGIGMALLTGRTAVANILLIFWILGLLFFLITLYWKVSVHAGVNAALVTFLVMILGEEFFWLYIVLLPVGWARISQGNHTVSEFTAGAILGALGIWGGFTLFGLI